MRFLKRHCQRHSRAVIASLMAGLVLLLNAMTASPSLHEWFHADAGETGHQCAVTLFAHGQVDASMVEVAPATLLTFLIALPPVELSFFHPAIEQLPAGRAPPVSCRYS